MGVGIKVVGSSEGARAFWIGGWVGGKVLVLVGTVWKSEWCLQQLDRLDPAPKCSLEVHKMTNTRHSHFGPLDADDLHHESDQCSSLHG